MRPGVPVDGPPHIDKLLRSTFDALTQARVWEDDARAVEVSASKLELVDGELPGAVITIWRVER